MDLLSDTSATSTGIGGRCIDDAIALNLLLNIFLVFKFMRMASLITYYATEK